VVAGLVGRSESWLSQVERGTRQFDSHTVLLRLADVLHVEVEELTGPRDGSGDGQRIYGPAAQIEQAMLRYDGVGASISRPPTAAEAKPGHLEAKARTAYRRYQATRYDAPGYRLSA
jgi:transcriptional regulator with XRE-family HTH domain